MYKDYTLKIEIVWSTTVWNFREGNFVFFSFPVNLLVFGMSGLYSIYINTLCSHQNSLPKERLSQVLLIVSQQFAVFFLIG